MYDVLTTLKQLENTPLGRTLVVIVKFRNGIDGIVDIHVQGVKEPVVSVEHSSSGWKAFCNDLTWIHGESIKQIFDWTTHKLSAILEARQ